VDLYQALKLLVNTDDRLSGLGLVGLADTLKDRSRLLVTPREGGGSLQGDSLIMV
jgi:hypothetical protein